MGVPLSSAPFTYPGKTDNLTPYGHICGFVAPPGYYSRPPPYVVNVVRKHKIYQQGGSLMNFYKGQHKFYCGIDLHARKMYLCILDEKGDVKLHSVKFFNK